MAVALFSFFTLQREKKKLFYDPTRRSEKEEGGFVVRASGCIFAWHDEGRRILCDSVLSLSLHRNKKNPFLSRCTLGVIASNCGPNAGPEGRGGEIWGQCLLSVFCRPKIMGVWGKGHFFPPTVFFCGEIEVTAVVYRMLLVGNSPLFRWGVMGWDVL